jgi:hypothetical protein
MSTSGEQPALPSPAVFLSGELDVMGTLWGEMDERSKALQTKFENAYSLLDVFKIKYSVDTGDNWQSYHMALMADGRRHVWVVGDTGGRMLHVVTVREVNRGFQQDLAYTEFALHADRALLGSVTGNTTRNDARIEGWTQATLGSCAVIEVYGQTRLNFVRGVDNERPSFARYGGAEGSIQHWDAIVAAERGLGSLGRLLDPLVGGGCHEAGVTGSFY